MSGTCKQAVRQHRAAFRQSSLEASGSWPAGHCMWHPDRWLTPANKTLWTLCRRREESGRGRLNNGGLITKIEDQSISTSNPILVKRRGQHLLDLRESSVLRGSRKGKKRGVNSEFSTDYRVNSAADWHTHKVDPPPTSPTTTPNPSQIEPAPLGSLVWLRPDDWLSSDMYGKWHHYKYIKGSGMVVALCLNRANFLNIILIALPSLQKWQINHGWRSC